MATAALLAVLGAALVLVARAGASEFPPPAGHVFAGLTGGTSLTPFERLTGKHPPVFEEYMSWDTPTAWLAAADPGFRARLGLDISTAAGYEEPGVITPGAIAAGRSDAFLLALGRNLARSRRIVYLRLLGEMDGWWNPYAAYDADGRPRGPANAPRAFIAAWRRTVLIVRGGPLASIDRRLRALGLPPVRTRPQRDEVLPRPRVAFLWVPQDAGSPQTAANSPAAFWPGSGYVDWVGTDFYASYPNFTLLDAFYQAFPGKPFVLSEWALYGSDDPGFVRALFAWVQSHPRVRMLNYYQGFTPRAKPSLVNYPRSRRALRSALRSPRFLAYPPEYAHPRPRRGHHPAPPERPPLPPQPVPPPPSAPSCLAAPLLCLP
jgi:hypothetical protein